MFQDVAKGVVRNTSIIVLQQIFTMAGGILLTLFLPRYLGAVEYGRLFLAISIVGIFQVLVNYGGNYLISKEVSRNKDSTAQLLVDSIALRMLFALLSIVSIILLARFAHYNEETNTILTIMSLGLLAWAVTTTFFACYQGHELLQFTSFAAVAERLFVSSVAVVALLLGANAILIAIIIVTGGFINTSVMLRFSKSLVKSIPKVDWRNAFTQIRTGAPYFFLVAFGTIYYRIDSVMLSKMVPEEVIGYYGVAYRFFESMNFPQILTVAVYPVLARLWKGESDMHRRTTQKSLEYVIMFGILMSIGMIAFSQEVVSIFYGIEEYAQAVILLQCLAGGMFFLYVDMILGTTLLASDKQKSLMSVSLVTIPINVVLNFILIPYTQDHFSNGGIGAAVATGITEIFVMSSFLLLLPKGVLQNFRYQVVFKSLLAGSCTSAFFLGGFALHIHWVLLGILGTGLYIAILFLARTIEQRETDFYKHFVLVTFPSKIRSVIKSRFGL